MRRTAINNYRPRALLMPLAAAVLAAGLLVVVGAKPAWAESRSFAPAQPYTVGDAPGSVTSAHFNDDGKADLAVANVSSDNVSVLLGSDNGTFQDAQNIPAGDGPNSVTSADFDGNGKADLVVTNYFSDSVSVLLGNGDGTFQDAKPYTVGDGPRSITSADFDGNGKTDLAVANTDSDSVSILLGNGDGTFQDDTTYTVGDSPRSITSADFNDDGATDLVTADDPFSSSLPDGVSLLLGKVSESGKGDGTFQGFQPLKFGTDPPRAINPKQIIATDFNRDGVEDLATANWGSNWTGGGGVSVFFGNVNASGKGDGTFQDEWYVQEIAGHSSSLSAADYNDDGYTDLAVADENPFGDESVVSVLLGYYIDPYYCDEGYYCGADYYGDGSFYFQGPAQEFPVDVAPRVTGANLDADGYTDLAVANQGSDNVSVLLNALEPPDVTPPMLTDFSPDCDCQRPDTDVTVYFSEDMDPTTITNETFKLIKDSTGEVVEVTRSYDSAWSKATLDPVSDLTPNAWYKATIKNGSSGVKDLAGNALSREYPDYYTYYFYTVPDTTPPAAPPQPDLDAGSDSGSSTSDNITKNNTPKFTGSPGSAEGGSTVKILVDGIEKGSATAATDGSYSVTTSTLADGAHSATATATDKSGNTSGQSPTLGFTVDTAAPTSTPPVHSYAVPSAVDSALSTSTVPVKLTWSGTDSGSGIAKYELQQSRDAGTTFATVASPTSTSLTQQLAPGTTLYKYQVRAEDKAGNIGAFVAQSKDFKVTSFQESSSALVDTGTWTTATLSNSYGGSVQYTSTAGRKVTFSIPAGSKNMAWVAPKASNRGRADVYLDGVFQQRVNLYSASTLARQLVFSKDVSTTTSHKLEVRVVDSKRVDIDAFLTTTG